MEGLEDLENLGSEVFHACMIQIADELLELDITDWERIEYLIKATITTMQLVEVQYLKFVHHSSDPQNQEKHIRGELYSLKSYLERPGYVKYNYLYGYQDKSSRRSIDKELRQLLSKDMQLSPRYYWKEGAIILLNLATTPPVAANFPDGLSLFKRTYEKQIIRRAKRVYNRYSLMKLFKLYS